MMVVFLNIIRQDTIKDIEATNKTTANIGIAYSVAGHWSNQQR